MAKGRILVVDDEKMDQRLAEHFLKNAGYETRAVMSGEEAITELGKNDYDLVMLDLEMPGLNGFETLRLIRNMGLSDLPVVMLTASSSTEDVTEAAGLNVADYIRKPFYPEEMTMRVNRVLFGTPAGNRES